MKYIHSLREQILCIIVIMDIKVIPAFAIIPLTQTPFGTELGNRTSINTNVFMSEPPIKNVNRLEFKFRYHDGRLVDFKNLPFSFVLEFNMLREEQQRNKIIRILIYIKFVPLPKKHCNIFY